MDHRQKLIDAAAQVYAESGYRGATTRRIADAAGVNEITLFRLFGSKAALIDEALRSRSGPRPCAMPQLPRVPVDPERELVAWCSAQLLQLGADRALIRKTLGELEERPEAAPAMCEGWSACDHELRDYVRRLKKAGFADPSPADGAPKVSLDAAASMLMAALFADAMGRDVMPELYPQPAERAPAMYVRCFLRAIGCVRPAAVRAPKRGAAARASRAATPAPRSRP